MESLFIGLIPPKEISIPLIKWVNQTEIIPERTNPFFPQIPLALCPPEIKRIDLSRYIKESSPIIAFTPFVADKEEITSSFQENDLLTRLVRFREANGFPDGLEYIPGYRFPVTNKEQPDNIPASQNWFLHLNSLEIQLENHSYRWSLVEKINIRREI